MFWLLINLLTITRFSNSTTLFHSCLSYLVSNNVKLVVLEYLLKTFWWHSVVAQSDVFWPLSFSLLFDCVVLVSVCLHLLLICSPNKLYLFCYRWWNMSMLKAWRSATLSLWIRKALYVLLCGTPSMTPSCPTPMNGQVSASGPRLNLKYKSSSLFPLSLLFSA